MLQFNKQRLCFCVTPHSPPPFLQDLFEEFDTTFGPDSHRRGVINQCLWRQRMLTFSHLNPGPKWHDVSVSHFEDPVTCGEWYVVAQVDVTRAVEASLKLRKLRHSYNMLLRRLLPDDVTHALLAARRLQNKNLVPSDSDISTDEDSDEETSVSGGKRTDDTVLRKASTRKRMPGELQSIDEHKASGEFWTAAQAHRWRLRASSADKMASTFSPTFGGEPNAVGLSTSSINWGKLSGIAGK